MVENRSAFDFLLEKMTLNRISVSLLIISSLMFVWTLSQPNDGSKSLIEEEKGMNNITRDQKRTELNCQTFWG